MSEHPVLNGITMTVEGSALNWQPLTHIRIKPMSINLIEGEFPVLMNGVHQPDVLLEEAYDFIVLLDCAYPFAYHKDKG